jgi:phosphoglycerate dehydrogenase-like enzyme
MTSKAMKILDGVGEVLWSDAENEDDLIKEVAGAAVVISEYVRITPRVLDASKDLRGVMVWGVGYDHVDVNAASEREQAFSFILALSRKLLKADVFVKDGDWTSLEESSLPTGLVGNDLFGKTLGIIGLGNIGRRIARIGNGFNMRLLAYDPYVTSEAAKKVGVKLLSLQKVLEEADFVTIHTVLSEETRGLISAKELALMKPAAYLINTSRGPVVDQKALIDALVSGRISGTALDVFEEEPIGMDNPLLKLGNVITTPHYAGNSREALEATSLRVSQETAKMIRGEIPLSLVNKQHLEELNFLLKK